MKNLRTCTLTAEDRKEFSPSAFTKKLQNAGFKFDSTSCPVKIAQPWDQLPEDRDGVILFRQWDAS